LVVYIIYINDAWSSIYHNEIYLLIKYIKSEMPVLYTGRTVPKG